MRETITAVTWAVVVGATWIDKFLPVNGDWSHSRDCFLCCHYLIVIADKPAPPVRQEATSWTYLSTYIYIYHSLTMSCDLCTASEFSASFRDKTRFVSQPDDDNDEQLTPITSTVLLRVGGKNQRATLFFAAFWLSEWVTIVGLVAT